MKGLADNSIDAVVTDPPYHLVSIVKRFGGENAAPINNRDEREGRNGPYHRASRGFMGKQWDGGDIAFRVELWAEVIRVLKPGGHVAAFSGTRTYHRMACAIEDAGFEVRDQLAWCYGSGFPKSHDVSKGIDKAAGAEREIIGREKNWGARPEIGPEGHVGECNITAPATDAARQWRGWGTALKPAWEPICLARKPLSEPAIAANVLRWGTGAINVDACRVEGGERPLLDATAKITPSQFGAMGGSKAVGSTTLGRWPANLCHDGSQKVLDLFPESVSRPHAGAQLSGAGTHEGWKREAHKKDFPKWSPHSDSGSAARFFYHAKASKLDRAGSRHPTVKPIALMQWLCRLITPPGGTILDCFAGSGTTGIAAQREGFQAILIEREAEYIADIRRRMGACPSLSEIPTN